MPYALFLSVLVVVLVGLPAAASAQTEQRRFVAWENGQPTLQIKARRNLDCGESSRVNPRFDAWRCFGRRYIYEPCFENLAEEEYGVLVCVGAPWEKTGMLAFSALDYDDRYRRPNRPWAIVLKNGKRCVFGAGASSMKHGRRANYFCRDRRTALWGIPNRSKPTWSIFQAGFFGRNWHREPIRTVWK
jgi:hypothetical protein